MQMKQYIDNRTSRVDQPVMWDTDIDFALAMVHQI